MGPPKKMHKIAIIEKIHPDGIDLLKNNSAFEFEIIEDTSEENLIRLASKIVVGYVILAVPRGIEPLFVG